MTTALGKKISGLFREVNSKVEKSNLAKKCKFYDHVNAEKQIAPCDSTAKEVSFEMLHLRISSTDSKVRNTLQDSIIYSGSESVKTTMIVPASTRKIAPVKVKVSRVRL